MLRAEGISLMYGALRVLDDVSLHVAPGQLVGVVGSTGSGKTTLLSVLSGLLSDPTGRLRGAVTLDGTSLIERKEYCASRLSRAESACFRRALGKRICSVPQNGRLAMDPLLTVGALAARVSADAGPTFADVGLAWDKVRKLRAGELSGGMAQRVTLALSLLRGAPWLLVDEWTTGLDVVLQDRLIRLLQRIRSERTLGGVFVTHELGVARRLSDRLLVMSEGRIVERLERGEHPQHPVSVQLFGIRGTVTRRPKAGTKASSPPIAALRGVTHRKAGREVLSGLSFALRSGETVGLAGASGSGKSTTARLLAGVEAPDEGTVVRPAREDIRFVMQNPFTSCNPEARVLDWVVEPARTRRSSHHSRAEVLRSARERLQHRGMDTLGSRRISKLSGGQRRWVSLLRTATLSGKVYIFDEPTAGLDAVARTEFAVWLRELEMRTAAPAILIISHDLRTLAELCDRILVLDDGVLVDELRNEDSSVKVHRHPTTMLMAEAAEGLDTAAWFIDRGAEVSS